MDLVISNARVISEFGAFKASVGIKGEKIACICEPRFEPEADEKIDACGKILMPGVIDSHVHMEMPVDGIQSSDDFTSGGIAACFGGVTTIIDFATPRKAQSLIDAVKERIGIAESKSVVDFSLHCAITHWDKQVAQEMKKVVRLGVQSFKVYMTYKERGLYLNDGELSECFAEAQRLGAVVCVHAENPDIISFLEQKALMTKERGAILNALTRPDFAEAEAVQRAIYLASLSDARIHIFHVSAAQSCMIIDEWRKQGYPVTAETCPHFLVLTDDLYRGRYGHRFACCPPLRTEDDNEYLWDGLADGVIQTVATDHCPFKSTEKDRWDGDFRKMLFGLPGIETLLPILYTHGVLEGRITEETFVRCLCTNPAMIFDLYPRKGTIMVGSDADLVLIDPEIEVTVDPKKLHMNCDFSPYNGMKLRGFPMATVLRGKVIQFRGKFLGKKGKGVFVPRKPIGV